jgi:uncharacterized membrane protein YdjX (TVP38/TMEM64 family)
LDTFETERVVQPDALPIENRAERPGTKLLRDAAKLSLDIFLLLLLLFLARFLTQRYLEADELQRLTQQLGFMAPVLFILVCTLVVPLFIPPLVFIGLGVLSFGSAVGAFYGLIGVTAGSCLAFVLGRYCVHKLPARFRGGRLKKWLGRADRLICRNASLTIIGLRLVFHSNAILNYMLASTSVKMRDYLLGTLLGLMPKTFILAFIFDIVNTPVSFGELLQHPHLRLLLIFPLLRGVGILLLGGMARWYAKAYN